MAYELVENADALCVFGNCFIESLVSKKPIVVDGDLIAHYVAAPYIRQTHGSLIVADLCADEVDADILGVFLEDGIVKDGWRYRWLRPVIDAPDAAQWTSEVSIENACRIFEHPAIVATPHDATTALFAKIRARPTCSRARVLFSVALETLVEHNAFTPLGLQVARPMIDKGLPPDWRW